MWCFRSQKWLTLSWKWTQSSTDISSANRDQTVRCMEFMDSFKLLNQVIYVFQCYKRLFSKCLFLIFKVARIKKETGVSIRIPPDDSNSDIIRIEGSPEGVSKAKVELIEMVEKMVNNHRLFWSLKIEIKFPLTTLIARCSLAYSAFLYTMYMYSNIVWTLCIPKLIS